MSHHNNKKPTKGLANIPEEILDKIRNHVSARGNGSNIINRRRLENAIAHQHRGTYVGRLANLQDPQKWTNAGMTHVYSTDSNGRVKMNSWSVDSALSRILGEPHTYSELKSFLTLLLNERQALAAQGLTEDRYSPKGMFGVVYRIFDTALTKCADAKKAEILINFAQRYAALQNRPYDAATQFARRVADHSHKYPRYSGTYYRCSNERYLELMEVCFAKGANANDPKLVSEIIRPSSGGHQAAAPRHIDLKVAYLDLLYAHGMQVKDSMLFEAVKGTWVKGNGSKVQFAVLKWLIDHGANVFAKDDNGRTVLMDAIRARMDYEVIEYLVNYMRRRQERISTTSDILNHMSNTGVTALSEALRAKQHETAELLLKRGVSVNRPHTDKRLKKAAKAGPTALEIAAGLNDKAKRDSGKKWSKLLAQYHTQRPTHGYQFNDNLLYVNPNVNRRSNTSSSLA